MSEKDEADRKFIRADVSICPGCFFRIKFITIKIKEKNDDRTYK